MLKRWIACLLAAVMILGLFACGGKNAGNEPASVEDEYFLPKEEGMNQLTLYWKASSIDFDTSDMWIWFPGKDGRGYQMYPCAYGAKCMINVPADVTEVGFIVRTHCSDPCGTAWGDATKDYDGDRFVEMDGDTAVYLVSGEGAIYYSSDGGATLMQKKAVNYVGIVSKNEIKYSVTPAVRIESLDQIAVYEGDRKLEVESMSSLGNEVVMGTIKLKEDLDVTKLYTVEIEGYEKTTAIPTDIFDSKDFIENHTYDGDDLGAVIGADGTTTFKVWAPTASRVVLNLYEAGNGGEATLSVDMELGEKGVWQSTQPVGSGTYYTYTVATAMGTQETTDPYAKALGVNGERGMVVDLDSTDPEGWEKDAYYQDLETYQDAIIWEVHVRDFSNRIADSKYPGKYLAFTETGLKNASGEPVGMDYLKDLGVTHIHLQPVYDYATVDESSDKPQFNWGYDPKNYNAPEGSYSTDPYHGEVRVNEFKQMVKALHDNGFAIVMDVVYNHTYDKNANLNKIVPYYYYRYLPNGDNSNGSGCGNETASERVMFRKFMVDSVTYWATEYHIDGFRFDLMGLHDIETMQQIEQAVHTINPKAIIYGEGWTGGTSTLLPNLQAVQANIRKVTASEGAAGSIAVFNDAIRDGLKGSVFNEKDQGYVSGDPSKSRAAAVAFGIEGGGGKSQSWKVDNAMIINYMSSHDNRTLWDKITNANPDATDEQKAAMVRLGAAIVMISKGTPFWLAGEEMLRSKDGDHNSYASSDAVNNLDWDALVPGSLVASTRDWYKSLIEIRKAWDFLRGADVSCEVLEDASIVATYTLEGETVAIAVINPHDAEIGYTLPEGSWGVLINGDAITVQPAEKLSGDVTVPALGMLLVIGDALTDPARAIVGTWELDDAEEEENKQIIETMKAFGMSMIFEFNADGTGRLVYVTGEQEDAQAFTYTINDTQLIVDGDPANYRIEGDKLYIVTDSVTMIYKKK
ncbi:MAG: type I pullulanase [Clostridia bacterium]|nr:type I pullulanase [Clostridia bacterium]